MVNELGLLWVLYLSDRRACTCAMLSPMVIPPFETFGTIALVKFITTSISARPLMPCLQKLGYRQFFRILQNLLGLRVLGLPHFGTPYNTRMVVRDIFVSGFCDPSKLRLLSLVGVKICDAFGIAFFQ